MPINVLMRSLAVWLAPICLAGQLAAAEILISPKSNLKESLSNVKAGDAIVLANGTWQDTKLTFDSLSGTADQPILIRAQTPGKVVLTGSVEFRVSGSHVIVSGFRFLDIRDVSDVFSFRTHSQRHAHHSRITDCSFVQTSGDRTDKESRWLNVYGTSNRVDHCYFAGKRNRGTTLVVWVAEKLGKHRIDHNHFGPRPKLGKNGGETIRIGTSEVSELESHTIVEKNYFHKCDGEAEIVSNKSCQNIYRHNVFDECGGALTLRHGHRCIVDANVFLGRQASGTGGVRIIGSQHRVTNNYFEGLRGDAERAAVCFMNGIPNSPLNGYAPVREALVAHNTFIDCKVSMEFGVKSSKKVPLAPTRCRVSHNAFLPGKWELFRVKDSPKEFTWSGNKYQIGKTRGAELVDIERVDIQLTRTADGLLRPIDAEALKTDDSSSVKTDIDGQSRDAKIAGCDDPNTTVTPPVLRSMIGPTWTR